MNSFDKLYKQLNLNQKKAVDFVEGPVMVIAGPGTGKTKVLTLRIANILRKTDINPENILALTFTETGVFSMRRGLANIIGTPAYSVAVCTFHGFCNEIIKKEPEHFPQIIDFAHITEIEQIKIIEDLIKKLNLSVLKPFASQFYYADSVLSSINQLKREGVSENDFSKIILNEEKKLKNLDDIYHKKGPYKGRKKTFYEKELKAIQKNKELAKIYRAYQERLRELKAYDYGDMILYALDKIKKDKNFKLGLQEQYHYFLIDEHQDTNNAQNQIIELLSDFYSSPNLFIVGDEKQAIFRFQGASLLNFSYFKNIYPKMKIINLDESYRASRTILDFAEKIIPSEKEKLKSMANQPEKKVKLCALSSLEAEAYFIARSIKEKLKKGVLPGEIAVIYRDNKDAFGIADILEKENIPFSIESDRNILEDDDIKKLIFLLRAIDGFGDEEKFIQAMHIDFLGIDTLDIYKIIAGMSGSFPALAGRKKMGLKKGLKRGLFEIIQSEKEMKRLGIKNISKIKKFSEKMSSLAVCAKNTGAVRFFEKAINETGFLAHILSSENYPEKIERLNCFFDEIKRLAENHKNYSLKNFLGYMDVLENHGLTLKSRPGSVFSSGRVKLLTGHRSKGLEFRIVFISKAIKGKWGDRRISEKLLLHPAVFSLSGQKKNALSVIPNRCAKEDDDKNNDERKLFYVALTRAKEEVIISYSKINREGRDQLPSRFVESARGLLEERDTADFEKEFIDFQKKAGHLSLAFKKRKTIKDKDFVKTVFLERGLSVTGLNNYLQCPWKYFYMNLLRMPKAKQAYLLYGTAVHNALRDFFFEKGDKRFLISVFEKHLKNQAFETREIRQWLNRGKEALSKYYDFYKHKWGFEQGQRLKLEHSVLGAMLVPDIKLTGKIDKIEFLGKKSVNVVDYKTGKPRTRNHIEGKTKSSDGGIKRQLVFYAILLEGKYNVVSGEIDFVEPNERAKFKKEKFEILPEEKRELKETIKKVSKEILNLDFWDKGCKEKSCEFCSLKKGTGPF